jgi:hypothetical protein
MADLKLQGRTHLQVIPSDTIDIPYPGGSVLTGTQTSATANKLTDSGATFTDFVNVGDTVYDLTGGSIATVTAIDSDTVLSLSADIFTATEDYEIFSKDAYSKDAVIYVGVTGNVVLADTHGNVETYVGVPAGMIIPVMGRRVNSTNTTATNMVAIW